MNDQDFHWVIVHEFERHGWSVQDVYLGNPMRHDEKYLLINQVFFRQATLDALFQPPNVVQMRTKSNLFELCRVQPTFVKQNNDDLILAIQSAGGGNVEETAFAKTSPQRRILNRRRTCWSIVPMALMLLIRCILAVRSFRSMIFMADLWVV